MPLYQAEAKERQDEARVEQGHHGSGGGRGHKKEKPIPPLSEEWVSLPKKTQSKNRNESSYQAGKAAGVGSEQGHHGSEGGRGHKKENPVPPITEERGLSPPKKTKSRAALRWRICQESVFEVSERMPRKSGNDPTLTQMRDTLTVRFGYTPGAHLLRGGATHPALCFDGSDHATTCTITVSVKVCPSTWIA